VNSRRRRVAVLFAYKVPNDTRRKHVFEFVRTCPISRKSFVLRVANLFEAIIACQMMNSMEYGVMLDLNLKAILLFDTHCRGSIRLFVILCSGMPYNFRFASRDCLVPRLTFITVCDTIYLLCGNLQIQEVL
jgi:hypothetical protein